MATSQQLLKSPGVGSSKSFVLTGRYYLDWVFVAFTADATVGNRQLQVDILDGAGAVLYTAQAGALVAASGTAKATFSPGVPFTTSGYLFVPLPKKILIPTGGTVKVYDSAAIAAATDTAAVVAAVTAA